MTIGLVTTAVLPSLVAAAALACPVCETDGGTAVRAGIAARFVEDLLVTVAPFPILLGVAVVVHRGWPPWRGAR